MDKKVALVTGGSRGIGAAIVKQLYKDGYCVIAASRGPLSESASEDFISLVESTSDISYIEGDIGKSDDRRNIVEKTLEKYGRIDVLCNNAGVAPKVRTDILKVTEDSWDYVMDVNLKGTMFMTQLVANIMKNQKDTGINGIIINTGSTSSWASSTNRAEYCASKAAVSMLTTLYADRLAESGILVYEIRPGVIATKMTEVVKNKYDKLIEQGNFPIPRWGQPEDVAQAVSCLCEGRLNYSTGEIINVDGGFHIRRL